ncbi:hypothetical protein ACHAXT_010991 [Thalassiosira profunda]
MSAPDIEAACAAFQRSIDDLLAKIEKKRRCDEVHLKECRRLVRHANHVLRTLTAKTTSLKHAVAAFRGATDEYVAHFSKLGAGEEIKRAEVLQRWFAAYIRLRDGFVLLESGERRHPHDGDNSKGVNVSEGKYKSNLSAVECRKDGTRAFKSANGYTGYGYDEVYYAEVGIKWRLLDILAKMGRKSRAWMEERTFDKDCSGARLFESAMDEHVIDESKRIRAQLTAIEERFVAGINHHLATNGEAKKSERLRLVKDDKSERLTLGLVDIARQGNAFAVSDAGGSLPFGMTVQKWRKKFELEKPARPNQETAPVAKKKRRVIDDDSSDEDGDNTFVKEPPKKQQPPVKKPQPRPQTKSKDGLDGLSIRKREATDVSTGRSGGKTNSITEMKRSLGVDTSQLEQGREHMEDEQLRSTMVAEAEDMQEELMGEDLGASKRVEERVNACLLAWSALQKEDSFKEDVELMREAQDLVAGDVFGSLAEWKERFQAVREMREKMSKGLLDESSDQAYAVRENFREALMHLGIDLLAASDFFSTKLRDIQNGSPNRCNSAAAFQSSMGDALWDIIDAYLRFAEEVFRTALGVVADQERCEAKSNSPDGVARRWEKGQHFLLSGRAHFNVGRALYEMAQHCTTASGVVLSRQNQPKELLVTARKELELAVKQSKALRGNTLLIHGHADAKTLSDHSENTWAVEAMLQSVEASGLESLASGLHIACLWKLDRTKEAEEAFDGFSKAVKASNVLNFAGTEGVAHTEIAEALEEMYSLALRLAGLSADSLESLSTRKGWNAKVGDDFLRVFRKAMARAATISEELLAFADDNCLHHIKERILSRKDIEEEGRDICNWWEATKGQAQRKLSDVVQSAHTNNIAGLSRAEVARGVAPPPRPSQFPRRIFVQDQSRPLQSRVGRTSRGKKKKNDDQAVSDRFSAEFGSGDTAFEPVNAVQQATATKYRRWGNEVLDPARKRCCPPLPDWMSPDLRRALETKLGDVLPEGN